MSSVPTAFLRALARLTHPHGFAHRLIQRRADEGRLLDADYLWLETHLGRCAACSAHARSMEALGRALEKERAVSLAPSVGFAERVMAVAREGDRERRQPSQAAGQPFAWAGRWITAGGLAAASAAALWIFSPSFEETRETDVEAAGTLTLTTELPSPHFSVRAPALGAARLRSVVEETVKAEGGQVQALQGRLRVRLPRGALVDVLARIEKESGLSVELNRDLENAAVVLIDFELE